MTKEALAEKIALSPDTLRRGIAGSQKMSDAVMQSVRNLVSTALYFSPGRKVASPFMNIPAYKSRELLTLALWLFCLCSSNRG
jgi:hypothetical protein